MSTATPGPTKPRESMPGRPLFVRAIVLLVLAVPGVLIQTNAFQLAAVTASGSTMLGLVLYVSAVLVALVAVPLGLLLLVVGCGVALGRRLGRPR